MASTTLTATGPADPATVWQRYAQLHLWQEWSPQITGVDADSDRLTPGLRGTIHAELGIRIPFEVHEVDEQAMTWNWTVHVPLTELRLAHTVAAGDGGGTVTTLTVEGFLPLVAGYAPLAQLALERLVKD